MTAEKDVEGIEERDRARYYGYDTIVFQNPGKSEEERIDIWKKAVAAAPSKIERDGQATKQYHILRSQRRLSTRTMARVSR